MYSKTFRVFSASQKFIVGFRPLPRRELPVRPSVQGLPHPPGGPAGQPRRRGTHAGVREVRAPEREALGLQVQSLLRLRRLQTQGGRIRRLSQDGQQVSHIRSSFSSPHLQKDSRAPKEPIHSMKVFKKHHLTEKQ